AVTVTDALGTTAGGTTVASGATLELNGNITVAENVTLNTGTLAGVSTPTLSGTLTLGAGTSTVTVAASGDTLTLSGVLSGVGDLNKTGTGALAIADTGLIYRLSGKTTVSGGTLSTTGDLVTMQTGQTLTIAGTMLSANGGVIDVDQAVVRVPFDGTNPIGTVVVSGTAPLVLLTTNTHTMATTTGSAMFDLAGNPANKTTESIDLGLVLGTVSRDLATDRPLRGSGTCPSCALQSTLLEASGATISGEKLLKVDAALVEATLPILKLLAASTLTLNGDAITLANLSKLVSGTGIASAMLALDASSMTINVGALINATGGSFLSVLGDLVRLSNTSTLTLNDVTNGYVLRVSGGSVVDIAGALIDFTGTGNKVKAANTYNLINNPTETFVELLGIRVHLTGGALSTQVEILGTPLRGVGTNGVIENLVGGVFEGSLIELNGTASRVRIKGN
ncbi:MAG: hypothetical protein HY444_01985, partial [Nitrospirae bacterium]|nr:hypothetical protein [Nitrospirota bacterium]